jgi:hypothetical protein
MASKTTFCSRNVPIKHDLNTNRTFYDSYCVEDDSYDMDDAVMSQYTNHKSDRSEVVSVAQSNCLLPTWLPSTWFVVANNQ